MSIVVDASVIARALSPSAEGSAEAQRTLSEIMADGHELLAPDLLSYEIGNVLRRAHGTPETRLAALERAHSIVQLVRPSPAAREAALEEAVASKLSFYDASYVALAREGSWPLWTEDQEILRKCGDVAVDTARVRASRRRS